MQYNILLLWLSSISFSWSQHTIQLRINNHKIILRVNRSKTKYCVFHNGTITYNSLPDVFKVTLSFSMFKSKIQNFYLEKYYEILMVSATMINFFLLCVHLYSISRVIVLAFEYWTVKFPIIYFLDIIRIVIVSVWDYYFNNL